MAPMEESGGEEEAGEADQQVQLPPVLLPLPSGAAGRREEESQALMHAA